MAAHLESLEEQSSEGPNGPEEFIQGEAADVLTQVVGQVLPALLNHRQDLLQLLTGPQVLLQDKETVLMRFCSVAGEALRGRSLQNHLDVQKVLLLQVLGGTGNFLLGVLEPLVQRSSFRLQDLHVHTGESEEEKR